MANIVINDLVPVEALDNETRACPARELDREEMQVIRGGRMSLFGFHIWDSESKYRGGGGSRLFAMAY